MTAEGGWGVASSRQLAGEEAMAHTGSQLGVASRPPWWGMAKTRIGIQI